MGKISNLELSSFRIDSYQSIVRDYFKKAQLYFEFMRIIERYFDERCDLLFTPKMKTWCILRFLWRLK